MCHAFCGRLLRFALIVVIGMGGVAPARALTTIDRNTTIDYAINDSVIVTRGAVVRLAAGGSITGWLSVRDNSTVNVDGGTVGQHLAATDTGTINVFRGSIAAEVLADGSSTVNVSGGSIGNYVHAREQSTVNFSGGSLGDVVAGAWSLAASDNGTINVRGGSVPGGLFAGDSSTVHLIRGSIGGALSARDTSTVNFSGGSVAEWVGALNSSRINWSGGSIAGPSVTTLHNGTIHIVGCDLLFSNPQPDRGGTRYLLTGTLRDGTPLNNSAYQGEGAPIVFHSVAATRQVSIDIVPGDAQNIVRLSKSVITVAILSTAAFDATLVNPLTVSFGPQRALEAHGLGHREDINGDGRIDLVLHFSTQQSGLTEQNQGACLQGATVGGCFIQCCGAVQVIP